MLSMFEESVVCSVWRLSWLWPRVFVSSSFRPVLTSFLSFENLYSSWMVSSFMSATFNVLLMVSSASRAHDPLLLC